MNRGWLSPVYAPVAQAGWQALARRVRADGRIEGICVSTTAAYDAVYYYNRPTDLGAMQGYGPTLMAGAEVIAMLRDFEVAAHAEHVPLPEAEEVGARVATIAHALVSAVSRIFSTCLVSAAVGIGASVAMRRHPKNRRQDGWRYEETQRHSRSARRDPGETRCVGKNYDAARTHA